MNSVVEKMDDGTIVDSETGELVEYRGTDNEQLVLLERAWRDLAQAKSMGEIKTIRDQASAAKILMRKMGMSREAQNEAAKIHLAASLRLGDWLRNEAEKAKGTLKQGANFPRLQNATTEEVETYADLGIEKTDAFRLQRLYDWEKETQGASKAVQELEDKERELVVSKLVSKAVSYFKIEKRIFDIEQHGKADFYKSLSRRSYTYERNSGQADLLRQEAA